MSRDKELGKHSTLIDENLKQIFQQEVDRELPDRFTNLIDQLRAKDAVQDKSAGKI